MSQNVDELAERIAARMAAEPEPMLSDAQVEAAARILGPAVTTARPVRRVGAGVT